jgi:LuxR family maltose regulon positive regulatory protein
MARTRSIPAKLVRPAQSGTFRRSRLFSILDGARPVAWVSGPPGAGKTTLVASYVESRKLASLWYQVDEGDGDPATLFYYLRQAAMRAAPRRKWRLPLLTPEYAFGLSTFTRRWFEELFAGLPRPFLLVLDNYHEAPADSRLHEVLRDALDSLPEEGRAAIVSRGDPPAALARLRAQGRMVPVQWDVLRLSARETAGIARAKSGRRISGAHALTLHAATDGWAAGLVLMLERVPSESGSADSVDRPRQAIFDYFAAEILASRDAETRRVLLQCAILPKLTAAQAEALTGIPRAGGILRDLARRRYFTDVHEDPEPTYQYHPLFREFLLARAGEQFSPHERHELRRAAAALLEAAGLVEDAAALLRQAEDWDGLARLAAIHAPALLAQGRAKAVAAFLRALPAASFDRDPWLSVWSGACAMALDPESSRQSFERAFEGFSQRDDGPGALVSWAGAVDAIVLQFADARRLDPWLARLEPLVARFMGGAPPEIEFRVAASVYAARLFRTPSVDAIAPWTVRAERLVASDPDVTRRILTAYYLGVHAVWTGDLPRARAVRQSLQELARSSQASPLGRIAALYAEAHTSWLTGELSRSRAAVESALQIAATTGVHIFDRQTLALGLYAALSDGDLDGSAGLLDRMASGLDPARALDVSHHRYVAGWHAHLRGDPDSALRFAGEALEHTLGAGVPFPAALCQHAMAVLLHERGDLSGARARLDEAAATGRRMGSRVLLCTCLLAEAEFAFDGGDEVAGREALEAGLAIARAEGYGNVHWWRASTMAALCVRALRDDIETDYVRKLIRLRRLEPPAHLPMPETWPWAVRVHALGGFDVSVDDEPVAFAAKAQRKPLALLEALVAAGGHATERELADSLWPDAEGDAAHAALSVTLHRLRRLLCHDDAIRRHEGSLELEVGRVWVDVRALESCLDRSERAAPEMVAGFVDEALRLYRGPLFGTDEGQPWIVAARERLRGRILRRLAEVARRCESAGDVERAILCCLKALDVDDRAEEFYRRLMGLYLRLGRRAEAIAAYQRCRETLAAAFGVAPSPETELVLKELRAGSGPPDGRTG